MKSTCPSLSALNDHAATPSLTGIGEVVLLPLDVLKIKRQVNPEAFRGRGIVRLVMEERWALYRGWGWTVARNTPGSFAVGLRFPSRGFSDRPCSFSVPPRQQRNTFSACRTTQKPHGHKTLLPQLPVLSRLSRSRHHSTRSKRASRMRTLSKRCTE